MITSQEEEIFRIFDFVSKEQANDLQVLLASINIVSKEEIVWFWRESSNFKYSEQINILSMDVSRNYKRWVKFNQIWLPDENLLRFFNEHLYLLFWEIHRLDPEIWSVSSDIVSNLKKGVNDIIEFIVIDPRLSCGIWSL